LSQRIPYNPNTAYGRKKLREEASRAYENDTPAGKQERDNMGCIVIVIIVVIAFLIFAATGNFKGFSKWMSH
jgi:hypothetical protein